MTIYDYEVKDTKGNNVPLSNYKGKVLLIVNTAISSRYTPQYEDLEKLYQKYRYDGFEILDFPCNQFGKKANHSNEDLALFCNVNYNTTFQTFARIEVNGPNESPLYSFLKKQGKRLLGPKIKWNFTKFLIDRKGNFIKRYSSRVNPQKIEEDVKKLL
jgi:glutathione peroxidase